VGEKWVAQQPAKGKARDGRREEELFYGNEKVDKFEIARVVEKKGRRQKRERV
jgi:hypothetical protein